MLGPSQGWCGSRMKPMRQEDLLKILWVIVRGAIAIINPLCGNAYFLATARPRPCAHCTGRCHSPKPARARHLPGGSRARQRRGPFLHEQHRARVQNPGLVSIVRIARAMDMTVTELMAEAGCSGFPGSGASVEMSDGAAEQHGHCDGKPGRSDAGCKVPATRRRRWWSRR